MFPLQRLSASLIDSFLLLLFEIRRDEQLSISSMRRSSTSGEITPADHENSEILRTLVTEPPRLLDSISSSGRIIFELKRHVLQIDGPQHRRVISRCGRFNSLFVP